MRVLVTQIGVKVWLRILTWPDGRPARCRIQQVTGKSSTCKAGTQEVSSDSGTDTDWLTPPSYAGRKGAHRYVWQIVGEKEAASITCFCICRSHCKPSQSPFADYLSPSLQILALETSIK